MDSNRLEDFLVVAGPIVLACVDLLQWLQVIP